MVTVDEPASILARAQDLAPLLRERAAESERLRTMPADVVAACSDAGVFKLALPRSLGGLECDPLTIIRVIETLAHADGSGGWTAMIGNTTAFAAWLDPVVAREIFADNSDAAMAGLLMPAGSALPDGNGAFTVSGRWQFNSGAPHSTWFCSGIMVMDDGRPRTVPPGRPDWRFAFFPASQATIIDTWHAAGLKGTGSHDISVEGIRVPEELTAAPFFGPAKHKGPLYRIAFYSLLMTFMAGIPLGIARRALDEFRELAGRKSRSLDGLSLADDPAIQLEFARAEADVQAARALVFDAFERGWQTLQQDAPNTLEERARMTMSVVQAMRLCAGAVDLAFHRAGGGALYDSSPLQRCFRDIHAAGQHIAFSIESWKRVGKTLLGVDESSPLI